MKSFIFAIVLVLAFCVDSWAINLRPYMQTPPEVQVFAKRVIEDGGQVVDLEYCQKYTRLSKQLIIWSNGKFVGDANMGVKLNSGVSVQTLYDLSGNNNDATQGTADNQPVWTAAVQGGRNGLVFDGTNDKFLANHASMIFSKDSSFYIGSVAKFTALGSSMGTYSQDGNYDELGTALRIRAADNKPYFAIKDSGRSEGGVIANAAVSTGVGYNIAGVYNGSLAVLFINGVQQTATYTWAQATGALPVVALATLGSEENFYLNGNLFNHVIFNVVPTTAQRTALESFVNAYYSIY